VKPERFFLLFALLMAACFSAFAQTNEAADALKVHPNFCIVPVPRSDWGTNATEPKLKGLLGLREYCLGFERNTHTGKMAFSLNGQPFLPVMYIASFGQVNPAFFDFIKRRNCNVLVLQMDAADVGSEALKTALNLCITNKVPVIVEINEWEYWGYLKSHLDLNMVMLNGKHVEYYPDFANPQAKEAHLARFKKAAQYLKAFAHSPVIAISVGAYDAFHLPDGEVHNDFIVPKHPKPDGTFLPYGLWVQKQFAEYLNRGEGTIVLPDSEQTSGSAARWNQWILFRRSLVKSWVKDTLGVVRKETGLPCSLTFDLNFSGQERYATPPFGWTDLMDFVIVYYYGREPSDYIPFLLRTVYKEFNDAGKPIVTLLEFSSAGKKTSGEDYARYSAPFVSGFITTGPINRFSEHDAQKNLRAGHTEQRIYSYLDWVNAHLDQLQQMAPPPADILILEDQQATHYENPFTKRLAAGKIPYDIAYVSSFQGLLTFSNYQYILLPPDCSNDFATRITSAATLLRDRNYFDAIKH
jgi:hypothetical protein